MSNGALGEANTATSATSSRLETLKSWLDANNVRLSSKLAIRAVPSNAESAATNDIGHEHSYGIFARENIQQDEILAVIPRSAILSKRTCAMADDPVFVEFCDRVYYTTPLQAGVRILATVLMLEILSGSASRWYGYIESMPQSYEKVGLPVFWEDQKALHWLQNTDVQAYMEGQRCTKPFLGVRRKVKHSWLGTFKLAFSLVLSRAFYIDNYHGLSMVPLADVFNHHFQPHATLQSDDVVCPTCGSRRECEHDEAQQNFDHQSYSSTIVVGPAKAASNEHLSETGDNDSVEMVATSPVTAGEEVFNTYGKLDNAALLANYGFRLDANEDDKVRWYSFEPVLNQAGLQLKQDDTIDEWRLQLKDAAFLQDVVCDDRISEERLSNPHLRNLPDLLFIDADSNISLYLWLLISTILQKQPHSTQTYSSGDYAVKSIETLVKGRLHQLLGHERDVDELFDLSNQERNSREVKLALSRVIDERLLLTACLAQWVPEDSDEACEGS